MPCVCLGPSSFLVVISPGVQVQAGGRCQLCSLFSPPARGPGLIRQSAFALRHHRGTSQGNITGERIFNQNPLQLYAIIDSS